MWVLVAVIGEKLLRRSCWAGSELVHGADDPDPNRAMLALALTGGSDLSLGLSLARSLRRRSLALGDAAAVKPFCDAIKWEKDESPVVLSIFAALLVGALCI